MADPRVSALVRKAAEEWKALGAEVGEVSVGMHKLAPEIWAVSLASKLDGNQAGVELKLIHRSAVASLQLPLSSARTAVAVSSA